MSRGGFVVVIFVSGRLVLEVVVAQVIHIGSCSCVVATVVKQQSKC